MTNRQPPVKNLKKVPIHPSTVQTLIMAYAVISLLSIGLVAITGGTIETWVHVIIIAAMSLLLLRFAHTGTKGNEKSLLRIRIVTAILIPALLITLVALDIPPWLRAEHVLAIAILLPVSLILFRRH